MFDLQISIGRQAVVLITCLGHLTPTWGAAHDILYITDYCFNFTLTWYQYRLETGAKIKMLIHHRTLQHACEKTSAVVILSRFITRVLRPPCWRLPYSKHARRNCIVPSFTCLAIEIYWYVRVRRKFPVRKVSGNFSLGKISGNFPSLLVTLIKHVWCWDLH